ncbi:hypothetical protein ABT218_28625 [Streptomyces sp. NPDC001455]|uniref:hypothetical protein n=1 Tax=Streptomyces sp. NPDC001455 TaxID=3154518 RepID=UPI00332F1BBA
MTTRPRPTLKSLPATPTGPRSAKPTSATSGSSAPKDVGRKAVPSSVCPGPQVGDGRRPIAWLTITAPRGATPAATSVCDCGRNLFAAGHRRVLALIDDHTRHRTLCPLRTTEERNAS